MEILRYKEEVVCRMKLNMNEEKILEKLRERQKEVRELPFHNLGVLTPYYKETAPFFKIAPWRLGVFLAIMGAIAIFLLLGPSFTRLASLIGRGF